MKTNLVDLKTIREAANLTQAQLARNLGLTDRTAVSKRERREDWRTSTIAQYVKAAGGEASLVVTINDETLIFDLSDVSLSEIREAAGLTQRDMADIKGLSRHSVARSDRHHYTDSSGRISVSKMERRHDRLLTKLVTFIHAAGGEAVLEVSVNNQELEFIL